MKKFLLDTNAIVSYLTDRNPRQREIIGQYFADASNFKCELTVLDIVIGELVYVLTQIYSVSRENVSAILKAMVELPGIKIDRGFDLLEVLDLWPKKIKDYGDAVLALYSKTNKIPIITFDIRFAVELKRCGIQVEKYRK